MLMIGVTAYELPTRLGAPVTYVIYQVISYLILKDNCNSFLEGIYLYPHPLTTHIIQY